MKAAARYLKGVPCNLDAWIDSSMCRYTTYFPKMQCVMRTCSECSVDKLEMRLKEENSNLLNENRKKYLVKEWETKREKIPATGKYRSFMHWRHDRLSNADLLNRYVNELQKMS